MKKILIYVIVGTLVTCGLNACYYDQVATIVGVPTNVSLKNDVQPIFDRDCNSSGCHDSKPSHAPSLTAENAYKAITTGGYVNVTVPESSVLYARVEDNSMPSGKPPLSENEKKLILGWITDGAKNN